MKALTRLLAGAALSAIAAMAMLFLAENLAASTDRPLPLKPPPLTTTSKFRLPNSYAPQITVNCATNLNIACQNVGPQHAPGSAFDNS